jgi:hypothetical protein
MVRALSDAQACFNHRGLEQARGAWLSTCPGGRAHAPATIKALIERGHLERWCEVVHITPTGERALADWQERQSMRGAA